MLAVSLTAVSLAGCSNPGTGESGAAQTGSTQASSGESAADQSSAGTETESETVASNEPVNPEDVALKIGDMEISAPEMYYYYLATRLQTEMQMGAMDWTLQMSEDGSTYGDYLKTLVESQVLQNVFWNSYAKEDGITLSEDDNEEIKENLASFNANISEADREFYGFNDENITATLEHIAIAGKVIEAEVQKQISQFTDEEKEDCVFRTVQHILLKTEAPAQTNESGEAETVSESDAQSYKEAQKAKADEVLKKAQAGEDFEALAEEYNEDGGFEYSLNKKGQSPEGTTYVQEFTDGAWALNEGEMSVVETEYGYHVMKCVSTDDKELTDQAQRSLAVSKYNDTYQQWLTDNNPTFYDGWKNFVVLNTPALASLESEAQSDSAAADESGSEAQSGSAAADESGSEAQSGSAAADESGSEAQSGSAAD